MSNIFDMSEKACNDFMADGWVAFDCSGQPVEVVTESGRMFLLGSARNYNLALMFARALMNCGLYTHLHLEIDTEPLDDLHPDVLIYGVL